MGRRPTAIPSEHMRRRSSATTPSRGPSGPTSAGGRRRRTRLPNRGRTGRSLPRLACTRRRVLGGAHLLDASRSGSGTRGRRKSPVFLGCSGKTSWGGKLVFFISCLPIPLPRGGSYPKKSNKLLRRRRIALCSRGMASDAINTPFFGSPPQKVLNPSSSSPKQAFF